MGSFDCVTIREANGNFAQDDIEFCGFLGERRFQLQFQVNEQEYFLTFSEDEERFYLIQPTETGLQRIPVYNDAAKWERAGKREKRTPRVQ
jgi:hypothetical protein